MKARRMNDFFYLLRARLAGHSTSLGVQPYDRSRHCFQPHQPCGELEDGMPFDGAGVGQAWPLLTGERAHFKLAARRRDIAENLLPA